MWIRLSTVFIPTSRKTEIPEFIICVYIYIYIYISTNVSSLFHFFIFPFNSFSTFSIYFHVLHFCVVGRGKRTNSDSKQLKTLRVGRKVRPFSFLSRTLFTLSSLPPPPSTSHTHLKTTAAQCQTTIPSHRPAASSPPRSQPEKLPRYGTGIVSRDQVSPRIQDPKIRFWDRSQSICCRWRH